MLCSHSWAELFAVAFASNSPLLAALESGNPEVIANNQNAPDGLPLTMADAEFFCGTFLNVFRVARNDETLDAQAKALKIMDVNSRCNTNRPKSTVWLQIGEESVLSERQQHQLAMLYHDIVTQKAIEATAQSIADGNQRRIYINKALNFAVSANARVYTECALRNCE